MKHLKIRISGKVQGVFFRASAKEKADEAGVTGFVRNEPDGKVYVEVEGEEAALKAFTEWCRQGPRRAQVENVSVVDGEVMTFSGFEIRR
jgi:acylphosphatase